MNLLKKALCLLCGFAAALLVAEVVLRLIGFPQASILPAEVKGTYTSGPHASFRYRGYLPGTFEDFANEVTLNQWGFHDADYATNRPTRKTFRVMVFGDSYVAALSVPLDQVFHKVIERRLRTEDPLGRASYEVIAFGEGARAQKAQVKWLRTYGPIYKPDLVLLVFFCGNDVMENSPEIYGRASLFARRYVEKVLPRKQALFDRLMLFRHSRLNGLVAEAATTWFGVNIHRFDPSLTKEDYVSPELGVYRKPLAPEWVEAFHVTDHWLRAMKLVCDTQGASFAIACLEGPQAIGDASEQALWDPDASIDFDQPARWLADWCATHEVPLCDLGPSLQKAGRRNVYWRHDGHLNPYGNEVIAAPLYEFIVAVSSQTNQTPTSSDPRDP